MISIFIMLCCLKNKFNIAIDRNILNAGKKIVVNRRGPNDEYKILENIFDDITVKYNDTKEVRKCKKLVTII